MDFLLSPAEEVVSFYSFQYVEDKAKQMLESVISNAMDNFKGNAWISGDRHLETSQSYKHCSMFQEYFERAAMQIITTKYSYEGIKNDLCSLKASRIWSLITVQCIFGAMEKYVLSLIISCKDKTHLLTWLI